jgi:23S rRNA (pseudouridine1915-N3)-methyltransferase
MADAIAEYQGRVRHYFPFETVEVREEPFRRGVDIGRVRAEEGARLLARVPAGSQIVALHREGIQWSSERLARYLGQAAVQGSDGIAFLIGGAFGLDDALLKKAHQLLSLSSFTFPHEVARLLVTEQLYRAGTILRSEPYHKGRSADDGTRDAR